MKAHVELNRAGIARMLKDPTLQNGVDRRASQIATASGKGYASRASPSRRRARAVIVTQGLEAKRDNSRHATILKNVRAARG